MDRFLLSFYFFLIHLSYSISKIAASFLGEESTPEEEISPLYHNFVEREGEPVSYTSSQYNKAAESVEGGVGGERAGRGNRVWGSRARLLDRFMHTECISSHCDASHAWTIDL